MSPKMRTQWKELTTPLPDDIATIKAAVGWPEPKRLVRRHSPEHEVLWRHSPISRTTLDSRSASDCWVLLTEFTFPVPVDTAWIEALPDEPLPNFEAFGEVHREEWAARARAIKRAEADWRAKELGRAKVSRGLADTGYLGIIFDQDLLDLAQKRHEEYLQKLASGPLEELPAEPPSPLQRVPRNPFQRPRRKRRAA